MNGYLIAIDTLIEEIESRDFYLDAVPAYAPINYRRLHLGIETEFCCYYCMEKRRMINMVSVKMSYSCSCNCGRFLDYYIPCKMTALDLELSIILDRPQMVEVESNFRLLKILESFRKKFVNTDPVITNEHRIFLNRITDIIDPSFPWDLIVF